MATAAELTLVIKAQNEATGAIKSLHADVTGLGQSLKNVASIAAGNILSKVTQDAFSLGKSLITTGIGFDALKEQANIAFTTMLGSGQKAKTFLDQLQSFAAKTPFEFPDLIKGAQRMLAMGFAASDVIPTLTSVGDAVAAMGGGSELIDQVTRALGQMQAKGKTSGEEMLQLTEAGIPAWKYLAEAIGTSVPEAMKKVTAGTVGAGTTIKAVTDGINKDFGGMMDQQSRTFSGMLSNLKDTFTQAAGTVVQPFFNIAKEAMAGLVSDTNNPQLQANLENISVGFLQVADSIYKATKQLEDFLSDLKGLGGLNPVKIGTDLGNSVADFIAKTLTPEQFAEFQKKQAEQRQNYNPDPFEVQIARIRQRQATTDPTMDDPGFQRLGDAADKAAPRIDQFGDAAGKAAEKTMTLGDAFRGALDNIRSAASSLFATPTREQAGINLNLDVATFALNGMQFAASQMAVSLDAASAAIGRNIDQLNEQKAKLSDEAAALSTNASNAASRASNQASYISKSDFGDNKGGEAAAKALQRTLTLEAQNAAAAQKMNANAQAAIDKKIRDAERSQKNIDTQKQAQANLVAQQQRVVDGYSRQAQVLEGLHKIEQDRLVLADQTLLSESKQRDMWAALLTQTQTFTGWLQQASDKLGISLIPGYDDAMNASTLFSNTLRDDVNPKMLTFGGMVADVTGALQSFRDQLSRPLTPAQPSSNQAPYMLQPSMSG